MNIFVVQTLNPRKTPHSSHDLFKVKAHSPVSPPRTKPLVAIAEVDRPVMVVTNVAIRMMARVSPVTRKVTSQMIRMRQLTPTDPVCFMESNLFFIISIFSLFCLWLRATVCKREQRWSVNKYVYSSIVFKHSLEVLILYWSFSIFHSSQIQHTLRTSLSVQVEQERHFIYTTCACTYQFQPVRQSRTF